MLTLMLRRLAAYQSGNEGKDTPMRITNSSSTHAPHSGGQGKAPHEPRDQSGRGAAGGAGGADNGVGNAGNNSAGGDQQAALSEAFNKVMSSIAIQFASDAMSRFEETMAETDENS